MTNPFLRPQSDVHLKSSLLLFAFFLVSAFATGLYLKFQIRSQPLAEEIAQRLADAQGVELAVKEVNFQFRRGWLPAVAVSVGSFTGRQKSCPSRRILAEEILVSLNIIELLSGTIHPHKVQVETLLATWPKSCAEPAEEDSSVAKEENLGRTQKGKTEPVKSPSPSLVVTPSPVEPSFSKKKIESFFYKV